VKNIPTNQSAFVIHQFTGLTPEKFADLFIEIGTRHEQERNIALANKPRKRASGAGRKPTSFYKLFVCVLVHLRWGLPYRFIGALFGIGKDPICRAVQIIVPMLADLGITREGQRITSTQDLVAVFNLLKSQDRAVLLDGTLIPTYRPQGDWETQKRQYNPHKHRHGRNVQVISDDKGNPLWVGDPTDGSVPDITSIDGSDGASALKESDVETLADKGYIGIAKRCGLTNVATPKRRRKAQEPPSTEEREFDLQLARERVRVEHTMRRLKVNKTLHGFRRRGKHLGATVKAVAALITYEGKPARSTP
jgi:hypothetical protein